MTRIYIQDRPGILKARHRWVKPTKIVIHHTAGGSLSGAVSHLKKLGLGYHYLIDKDGSVSCYVPPEKLCYHSFKRSGDSIGISYVGGQTPEHAINEKQMEALIHTIKHVKNRVPSVKYLTGHKHVDPRTKSSRWPNKVDPYWPGDTQKGYVDGHNWVNDEKYMGMLCSATGLEFYSELVKYRDGKY